MFRARTEYYLHPYNLPFLVLDIITRDGEPGSDEDFIICKELPIAGWKS